MQRHVQLSYSPHNAFFVVCLNLVCSIATLELSLEYWSGRSSGLVALAFTPGLLTLHTFLALGNRPEDWGFLLLAFHSLLLHHIALHGVRQGAFPVCWEVLYSLHLAFS